LLMGGTCMVSVIEIHNGSKIIGNIYYQGKFPEISENFWKFPPNTKFPEKFTTLTLDACVHSEGRHFF